MKVALVCSHGGHYTEMLKLLPAFSGHDYFFVTYHSARESEVRALAPAYFFGNIGMNPLRLAASFLQVIKIFYREKPDIVLSTGAEIGLPALYLGRLLGAHTIYIESWCRTRSASLTGRLVYPVAHEFLVQWPEMLRVYGSRAKFYGGVA